MSVKSSLSEDDRFELETALLRTTEALEIVRGSDLGISEQIDLIGKLSEARGKLLVFLNVPK